MEQNDRLSITVSNIETFRGQLTVTAADLPYDLWSVFSRTAYENCATKAIVPVTRLISRKNQLRDPKFVAGTKADPRQTALNRMKEAARGEMPGREPIKVIRLANEWFDVIDGNATSQVLMLLGWQDVPAEIMEIESHVGTR